jgi:hypothetical protein
MKKEGYKRKTIFEKKNIGSHLDLSGSWVDQLGRSSFTELLH